MSGNWQVFWPAIIMCAGAMLALLADLLTTKRTFVLSWASMLASSVAALVYDVAKAGLPFGFDGIILIGTILIVVASAMLHGENAMPPGEFQFLLGSASAGALVMVGAQDYVTLIVGLELLTLPSIALVGLRRGDRRAIASAWTFFLASVVSTAITLMGIAMIYGLSGSLRFQDLALTLELESRRAFSVAVALTVIGFLFKIGAVPLHAWVPDAYRGASPVVAAFLSSVSKAAVLGALLVLLYFGLPLEGVRMSHFLVPLVVTLSMTAGNMGALRQKDGVALLAWSSISQAGFLIAPALSDDAFAAINAAAPYVAVYALANIVGFVALAVVLRVRGSTSYDDLSGLARTDPWVGVPLAFAALVLAGFPPAIIGLVTKYVVFVPVLSAGWTWVAVIMAINVMIALAYYLKFVAMLFAPAESTEFRSVRGPLGVRVATAVAIVGTVGLLAASSWPSLVLDNVVPLWGGHYAAIEHAPTN